mmetsp:Transcript_2291/g.4238  ORF Transcript_2291/g.4238 Transcript_2291/m.4238 type:complete len:680 (+) Transcript_2291:287-2326(+)
MSAFRISLLILQLQLFWQSTSSRTTTDATALPTDSNQSLSSSFLRPSLDKRGPQQEQRELIIGGFDAAPDRFPYYVALQTADFRTECGGSLIAPDVVLTAAHCQASNLKYAAVGKYWYDSNNVDDGHERIEIVNPLDPDNAEDLKEIVQYLETSGDAILDPSGFVHPLHSIQERTFDIMLMKLARPSSKPLVQLNFDSNVPQRRNGNEIVVVGLGRTEVSGAKPEKLQQVYLDFLPYDECIDSDAYNVNYKFELLPDMMCTRGVGVYTIRGQCYGDSGGPYLMLGDDPSQDVQVGTVSWAVNCASSVFPMVGSRTSASSDFIRDVTCAVSMAPPESLCNPPVVGNGPFAVVENGVPVSVNIYSDPFPHEISWKITDTSGDIVYAEISFGSIRGDHDFQQVMLPPGADLVFSIMDAADDGIFGNAEATMYELILVDQNANIVLVKGNGAYESSMEQSFRVPLESEYAALMPAKTDPPNILSGDTVTILVHIRFADFQEDLSWAITDVNDETNVFVSKGPDEYRYGEEVTEEVELPTGAYKFIIRDRLGPDEFRAYESYSVSFRDQNGETSPLFENADYRSSAEVQIHTFDVPRMIDSSVTQAGTVVESPQLPSSGQGEHVVSSNSCFPYGAYCETPFDCCSGRCAANICRNAVVSRGRDRNRLGRSTRGGAASRSVNGSN